MKPFFTFLLILPFALKAQDTIQELKRVEVRAFDLQQPVFSTPATISTIGPETAKRFPVAGWVPVLNTAAGVRMEERSPGSYRLSVRGSLLRSPFGVRNVKFYWNGMVLTDAGGNTYFNLLDRNAVSEMEIIKGPAGSLYGSGTGGVLLMNHEPEPETSVQVAGGSYGFFSANAAAGLGNEAHRLQLRASHQQSDGYRNHSRMQRSNVQASGIVRNDNWRIDWLALATHLEYQTPGGLTREQFEADPKQARPGNAFTPGAEEQQAGIINRNLFGGTRFQFTPSAEWKHEFSVSGMFTDFRNPFITNYEEREEPGVNGRYLSSWKKAGENFLLQTEAGAEYGYQFVSITNYDNNGGEKGNVQYDDRIRSWYLFPFVQTMLEWKQNWNLQVGVSYNTQGYAIRRLGGTNEAFQRKTNTPQWLPRLALQHTVRHNLSIYGILSKGFSAPTVAEIRPSDGSFRPELQPEYGWNNELGIRFRSNNEQGNVSLNAFRFRLNETIVRRMDAGGAEFFVNAGNTLQQGLEMEWNTALLPNIATRRFSMEWWGAFSWYDFRFRDYTNGDEDFSGNKVTGIPGHTFSSGIHLTIMNSWSLDINGYHCAAIPLTDAGDEKADPYFLAQARVNREIQIRRSIVNFFLTGDNLLDTRYSLGNDLNAFGRRFYNAAPRRSIELGAQFKW